MTIDDRVRHALHDYADPIEPDPGSWERIEARFDEPLPHTPGPSRLTAAFAAVALALVVVLVATLMVRDDGSDGARVAATGATGMPSRILAVTAAGTPVILETTTGRQIFEYDVGRIASGSQIAITPNGHDAYVVQGAASQTCAEHQIVRLGLRDGGPGSRLVAKHATAPTVSPDGRSLGYLQCSAAGREQQAPPPRPRARYLAERDLVTGEEGLTGLPDNAEVDPRLAFSSDSHLLFGLDGHLRTLEYVPGENAPGHDLGIASWVWPRGRRADEYLVVKGLPGTVNVARGPAPFTMGRLFRLPDDPTQLAADASGDHVLAIVDESLYRWSEGDEEPTMVADGIVAAAWIADAPPEHEPLPNGVVAARGGQIVVLGAIDGAQHSSLGDLPQPAGISATSDGRTLALGSVGPTAACVSQVGPQLERLDTVTRERRVIAGGAYSPVVSPKGLVAYGYGCDGDGLGMTNLSTDENYRTDALGGTERETDSALEEVSPLGWSPDGTRLLYRGFLKGYERPYLYVGRLWPAVRQAATEVIELPVGPNVATGVLVDNDRVALAMRDGGSTSVRAVPIRTLAAPSVVEDGHEWSKGVLLITGEPLFELSGGVTSLVADPSGRHLLAVTDSGALYRWSRGDAGPTKLADGVSSATWVPWS